MKMSSENNLRDSFNFCRNESIAQWEANFI